jgi:hypothetical protein
MYIASNQSFAKYISLENSIVNREYNIDMMYKKQLWWKTYENIVM